METTQTRSRGQKSIGHELDHTRGLGCKFTSDADARSSMPSSACDALHSAHPNCDISAYEMPGLTVAWYLNNPIPIRLTGDLGLSLGSTRSARGYGPPGLVLSTPCHQQAFSMPTWDLFVEAGLVNSLIRRPSSRTPQRFVLCTSTGRVNSRNPCSSPPAWVCIYGSRFDS